MSNGTWSILIMAAALLVPLLVFGAARGLIRVGEHPRWAALAARNRARHERRRERFGPFYMHVPLGVSYVIIGLVYVLRGDLGDRLMGGMWIVIAGILLYPAYRDWREPGWLERNPGWDPTRNDPYLFPEDGDLPGPDEAVPPAPAPMETSSVWHRPDRPLSASELRRRARGQQLEPPA